MPAMHVQRPVSADSPCEVEFDVLNILEILYVCRLKDNAVIWRVVPLHGDVGRNIRLPLSEVGVSDGAVSHFLKALLKPAAA